MRLVTIDKKNRNDSEQLIARFHELTGQRQNSTERALMNGEVLFVLVDDTGQLLAGALMRKNVKDYANWVRLQEGGRPAVSYIYNLVAAPNTPFFMPGMELQRRLNHEFKNKTGAFGDVDVITANIVQRNLMLAHEGTKEAGLRIVVKKDPVNSHGNENAFFVIAAADPGIQLVPLRQEHQFLTDDTAIREEAHRQLVAFKDRRKLSDRIRKTQSGEVGA